MIDKHQLEKMFEFHGHKCWASALGFRAGLIALKKLGVERAKAKELYTIIETGSFHGGGCFGDGVQFATGCTAGKGNFIKKPRGKLAFTLIDIKDWKEIRISINPKIKEKIAQSAFMKKRAAGIPPYEIPEEEIMEVVNYVLDSPEDEVLIIGEVKETNFEPPTEVMGMINCEICGELVAKAFVRVIGQPGNLKLVCIDCAGYEE